MDWRAGSSQITGNDVLGDGSGLTGELLALCAAFAFGMSTVAILKGAKDASAESGVLLSALMTGLLSAVAWVLIPGDANAAGEGPVTWSAIAWFAASGLLATVAGRVTMYRSIELAGVIRASTTRRLMPLISLLLSWIIIGEVITPTGGSGMALIALSFVFLFWDNRSSIRISTDDPQRRATISRGLAFGVASASVYAISFIARKFGLDGMPNAFFGALVGSLTAILFYGAAALVSERYRAIVASAFATPSPWHLLAALLISVGQIAQFGALMFSSVGTVTFINSVEVYIAAFLAVAVFRTEAMPSRTVLVATVFATIGVALLAVDW